MTLRHIKIFVTVCQCESITKAASRLHLAQPSVSLAISELEQYYGIRLFDRMSRRIFITDEGRRFYDYAIHIASLFDDLEKGFKTWDASGTLRIGAGITIGTCLLPNLILCFQKEYPLIRIQAVINNYSALEEALLDNRIDFALIEGSPSSPKLAEIPFMKDRLCLICGAAHPLADRRFITPQELTSFDFLLRETGSATRETVESLCSLHGLKIRPAWESASNEAILEGIKKNLGITILPRLLIQKELSDGTVRELSLEHVDLERSFSVIYHKNKYLPESARAFIQLCSSHAFSEVRD